MVPVRYRLLWNGFGAFAVLLLTCVLLYGSLWGLDFLASEDVNTPADLVADPAIVQAMAGLPEVIVAVLGIAITVVAIIVELASNRYSPRISEMFVRGPVNAAVLGLYVVTTVQVFWTDLSLHGEVHPTNMIMFTLCCVSVSLMTVLPYLSYVFGFLHPHQIIMRIERMATDAIQTATRGKKIERMRHRLADSTGELGELACNSIERHDKSLALAAVDSLAEVALAATRARPDLPDAWFVDIGDVSRDTDFVALDSHMVESLARARTWVEMKVLRQYESVFRVALNRQRDVCHVAAVHTRRLGVAAWESGHRPGLELAYRFLNTYLRACVTQDDIRTGYNVFNEYRELTATIMAEDTRDEVVTACQRFQYYGQLAWQAQRGFLLETTAYDVGALLAHAWRLGLSYQDQLLAILLELDHEPDAAHQESSLRGVRKAQVKLACFYLLHDDIPRARRIHADMADEAPERLASIKQELQAITNVEFWELTDRWTNFDWMPPDQRDQLDVFFGWFTQAQA